MPTNREISEFLLRACHDLRTPLRAVRAHTELLQKGIGKPGADLMQPIGFVVDAARKADLLVDGIGAYAVALQIYPKTFHPSQLGVLLRSGLAKLAPALQSEGAEVTYDELPRINGNPDRLIELFEKLIRNALDHRGPDAPRVHVNAARQAEGEWSFSVRDNGPGVEATEIETIFRPFEKLHGKGAGLGLATCRAIVEAHGGKMWAEPPPEGGLTIRFTLPE
jgi:signal transduction histidine kinase